MVANQHISQLTVSALALPHLAAQRCMFRSRMTFCIPVTPFAQTNFFLTAKSFDKQVKGKQLTLFRLPGPVLIIVYKLSPELFESE